MEEGEAPNDARVRSSIPEDEASDNILTLTGSPDYYLQLLSNAIQLWNYQGQINWNRFSIMLIANSIIVAIIGSDSFESMTAVPKVLLPIIGLLMCAIWLIITIRGFAYHAYWIAIARKIEGICVPEDLRMIAEAEIIKSGAGVTVVGNNWKRVVKMHPLGRLGRQRSISYICIIIFAVLFAVLLVDTLGI